MANEIDEKKLPQETKTLTEHFKAAATAGLLGAGFTSVAINLHLLELDRIPLGLHLDAGIVGAGLIYAMAREARKKTSLTSTLTSAAAYSLASATIALGAVLGTVSLETKRQEQEAQNELRRSSSEVLIDCTNPAEVAEAREAFKGQLRILCKP